jgi:hypothetical protein
MITGLAVAALALVGGAGAASVHPAEIEARLAPLVGDWTIEGHEATYRETCEWFAGRSFVVCNTTDSSDGSASQSVLGYSAFEQRFTYHNYTNSGTSNTRFGYPFGDNGLAYTLERRNASGYYRVTTYIAPQPDGRLHFREERSTNGAPWKETANFYYVRRLPADRL